MLAEAALEKLDHGGRGDGRTRGCTKHAGDGAVLVVHQGGAELQGAEARGGGRLDHLHALAGDYDLPVLAVCCRVVLVQHVHLAVEVAEDFLHQVLHQADVGGGHAEVGRDVVRADGLEQVQVGAFLEELRTPAAVGAEQEGFLAVDHAQVQVRHGHRRGADLGLAVDLGLVLLHQFLVVGLEPHAGDREAGVAVDLGHTCVAQQVEGVAAGADEDEAGAHDLLVAGVGVFDGDLPEVAFALDVGHFAAVADLGAVVLGGVEELLGQRAVVDVGACVGPGDGHRLCVEVAALGHQRQLLREGVAVVRELHVGEHVVCGELVVALAQVVDLVFALGEGDVRHGVDEGARVGQHTVFHLVGPELARQLELLVDVHRLGDINAALLLGRVVQLAQRGVAGASVVEGVGGLLGRPVKPLEDHLGPFGFQFVQHRAQRGAHDAGADVQDVHLVRVLLTTVVRHA